MPRDATSAARSIAYHETLGHLIYAALAESEPERELKDLLEDLAARERADVAFWNRILPGGEPRVSRLRILAFKLARKVFGLTFTVKLLERREAVMIERYTEYLATVTDGALKRRIGRIIAEEESHERELAGRIREERVEFVSNVVLGLNDGLIELTGVLVGFSFAFARPTAVALAGLITDVSAALSMASSAYLQARHEPGKNPVRAGAYTGAAYLAVVACLITPFLIADRTGSALAVMLGLALGIIAVTSLYTAVLFERKFSSQFGEMLLFSVGVSALALLVGVAFRSLTGIEV